MVNLPIFINTLLSFVQQRVTRIVAGLLEKATTPSTVRPVSSSSDLWRTRTSKTFGRGASLAFFKFPQVGTSGVRLSVAWFCGIACCVSIHSDAFYSFFRCFVQYPTRRRHLSNSSGDTLTYLPSGAPYQRSHFRLAYFGKSTESPCDFVGVGTSPS